MLLVAGCVSRARRRRSWPPLGTSCVVRRCREVPRGAFATGSFLSLSLSDVEDSVLLLVVPPLLPWRLAAGVGSLPPASSISSRAFWCARTACPSRPMLILSAHSMLSLLRAAGRTAS